MAPPRLCQINLYPRSANEINLPMNEEFCIFENTAEGFKIQDVIIGLDGNIF